MRLRTTVEVVCSDQAEAIGDKGLELVLMEEGKLSAAPHLRQTGLQEVKIGVPPRQERLSESSKTGRHPRLVHIGDRKAVPKTINTVQCFSETRNDELSSNRKRRKVTLTLICIAEVALLVLGVAFVFKAEESSTSTLWNVLAGGFIVGLLHIVLLCYVQRLLARRASSKHEQAV